MSKKKKQHYVPQFYLRNFVREDNHFTLFNIKKEKIIENAPCKDQCYENYFYGEDEIWENKLAKIEKEAAIIISKINTEIHYYPSDEEIELLKRFVLYQKYRTTKNKENLLNLEWKTAENALNMKLGIYRNILYEHVIKEVRDNFKKQNEKITIDTALELAEEMIKYIKDLELLIIKYETAHMELISSDNPVILHNAFYSRAVGLSNAGLVMFLPISSKQLLVFFDSKMYPKYKGKKSVKICNYNEVKMLNIFQIISAEKIVYIKNRELGKKIEEFYKISQPKRKLIQEMNNLHAFGDEMHKILAFHQEYVPINYSFSFCKPIERSKGFGKNEIDWFPRWKMDDYEIRMKDRIQIFNTPDLRTKLKFNTKNVKNIERFNKFVYDYWNDKL